MLGGNNGWVPNAIIHPLPRAESRAHRRPNKQDRLFGLDTFKRFVPFRRIIEILGSPILGVDSSKVESETRYEP